MCPRFSGLHPACGAQATQRLIARNIAFLTDARMPLPRTSGAAKPMISPRRTEVTYPKSENVRPGAA
jgi:hypothetical protein